MIETRAYGVGGREVRCLEAGEGDCLVLIHAFPLSADQWQPQLAAPPPGWRVVAPDLRGFRGPGPPGTGGAPMGATSIDEYAADIVALLDRLEVDRAVVAGLSMGGYIAFGLVRIAPERVRGLVLADTRPQADSDETRARRRHMLARLEQVGVAGVADDLLPTLVGRTTLGERPAVVARVRALIEANAPEAIAAAVHALIGRPDSTPLLPQIRVPTLVIVGEEDTLTPPDVAEAMHRAIAGSALAVIPSAGHVSNLEHPEAFTLSLAAFLQRDRW